MNLTGWLPAAVVDLWRRIRYLPRRRRQRQALLALAGQPQKKIVIGSSATGFSDWISTDKDTLDLLSPASWSSYLQPGSVDVILAEHVWEHLTPAQAATAASTCYTFLKPGGHLRVAVPDGFHPDPAYIDEVRPGGHGDGSFDHQVLYTHDTLAQVFTGAGFAVTLLEFFDADGKFHAQAWHPDDGMIRRSLHNDPRNAGGKPLYTSIILDAKKPG